MCNFKSGIILKNKTVIAEGENESHTDLLESLGIEDSYIGASKTFVRAELIPNNGEWWVSPEEYPEDWCFVVDQDIVPEWFDKSEYERIFRESVCAWWKVHVLVDQKIEALTSGYYRLKRCEVKKLCNDVKVFLESSNVGEMRGSSNVGEMWESSNVGVMWESSNVGVMWGSSNVGVMRGSSNVGVMRGSSNVGVMWESSNVGVMWESSNVGEMWESSNVGVMWESSNVGVMWESSNVGVMWESSNVGEMRGSSNVGVMRGSSNVGVMWESSNVGVMWESSNVGEMRGSSNVGEMRGSSTARDFKNYPKIKVMVPADSLDRFEMIAFENKTEESANGSKSE